MNSSNFFKSGGLIRVSQNLFVSIFALMAVLFAFASDFSVYTALVLFSILVHEVSHIVCLKAYKAKIIRAVVYPFGIDMVCDTSMLSETKELVCVISGGLSNVVISLVFWQLFCMYDAKWMLFFCICNACIGLANLIPISSFDGGRALYLLLSMVLLPDKVYIIQKHTDTFCLCIFAVICFCFLDFCGFNLSLLASMLYCLFSSVIFGLYKKDICEY